MCSPLDLKQINWRPMVKDRVLDLTKLERFPCFNFFFFTLDKVFTKYFIKGKEKKKISSCWLVWFFFILVDLEDFSWKYGLRHCDLKPIECGWNIVLKDDWGVGTLHHTACCTNNPRAILETHLVHHNCTRFLFHPATQSNKSLGPQAWDILQQLSAV